ncbi:MAG: SurA N-terminal domain-containing protein [Paludibacteraceae bacterium]|nr:SurA N-terminal domain-containing protein [Paludibacteraceae bacterium]
MATLQKIRSHGVLLLVVIGVAMLSFILGFGPDLINSFKQINKKANPENIGVINGNAIHILDYNAAVDQLTEVYKMESGRNDFDEDIHAQIRNQVWNMYVMDYTMRDQADKIGMEITKDELTDLCIGNNIHEIIRSRRAFYDENGQFNPEIVKNLINSINEGSNDPEQNAYLQRVGTYWMYWEKAVRITYMQEKYTSLLQHMLKANTLDAEYAFNGRQNGVAAEYVMQPYFMIADSLVSVSESDIKKLYKEHKAQYKQTPNRAIKYVVFDIAPAEEDYKEAHDLLAELQEEFRTAEDVAAVVNMNSDVMYDGRDYSEETVPALFKDFAFAKGAKAGDCTEILFDEASMTYAMARIVKNGYNMPDSVELKAIVEGGEDQELGWFRASDLPKDIAEPAFAGKRGTRFTVAQGMGEQTFEVMEVSKATPKVKLAIMAREVSTSNNTNTRIYGKAQDLVANSNKTAEGFEAKAQEMGLAVIPQYNLLATTEKVGQLKGSRSIVRWAFDAKEGDVSEVFECGMQYVVAAVTEVNDDEFRPLEAVRAELNYEATNNAKAAYLTKELEGIESLEAIAEKVGQPVQTVDRISLSDNRFGNAGMEPAVIGAAIAMGENTLSEPIKGNMGVFVIKTGGKLNLTGEFNAEAEKAQLATRFMYLPYQAMQLIQDEADITDNRANFQ